MARLSTNADREALRALWQSCFDDPPAFTAWFFARRFLPESCALSERGGRVVSCAHALPVHVRVRDSVLPGALIAGVATDAAFRRQGLMRETMTLLLRTLHARGMAVTVYHPQEQATYYSLGHYDAARARFVTLPPEAARPAGAHGAQDFALPAHMAALHACYTVWAARYSLAIARSFADFAFKCEDYAACGARCVAVRAPSGQVEGYCVYFDGGEELLGEECVALTETAYERLLCALARRAAGKRLRVRMADDVRATLPGARAQAAPHSVLGAISVPALLRAAGAPGGVLRVSDPVIPENNGVFDARGERTDKPPAVELPAGRLAQWAAGFRTLADIAAAGEARVLDAHGAEALDRIGARACFLSDEY